MIDEYTFMNKSSLPPVLKLKGIVSPFPSGENYKKYESYLASTKKDAFLDFNSFPIHLTETSLLESISGKTNLNYRAEFNEYNSALCWLKALDVLIIYDDFGIDHFCLKAIELAKKYDVDVIHARLN